MHFVCYDSAVNFALVCPRQDRCELRRGHLDGHFAMRAKCFETFAATGVCDGFAELEFDLRFLRHQILLVSAVLWRYNSLNTVKAKFVFGDIIAHKVIRSLGFFWTMF